MFDLDRSIESYNLVPDIPDFKTKWDLADVAITCRDLKEPLYASKHVLAIHSSYFKALFFGGFAEATKNETRVEADFEIMYEILMILHQVGRCVEASVKKAYSVPELLDLFQIADMYHIPVVMTLAKKQLAMVEAPEALDAYIALGFHEEKSFMLRTIKADDIRHFLQKENKDLIFSINDVNAIIKSLRNDFEIICPECEGKDRIVYTPLSGHFNCFGCKTYFSWTPKNCKIFCDSKELRKKIMELSRRQ